LAPWLFPVLPLALAQLIATLDYIDRRELNALSQYGYIKTGSEAPDFSLPDQNGNTVHLSDYKGKNPLLLIFVRGDWCPGCHIMLRTYERERKKFQERNVVVMAIGPDPVGINLNLVQKLGLEYKVLSDEHQETAKKYCVKVQTNHPPAKLEFIPLPASFLIHNGILHYTSRADVPGEILDPSRIFSVLEKIS
jgi:peroxiredoxin